ncbi:hypothetical protein IMSAGC011_01873 [Lachnospiraceae bacterium]|nr:hypothetical protein IMSAGC011_01873 [Lachnospiraceae bacterium]
MKCPRCQTENNTQARFCVQCGYDLSTTGQMKGAVHCACCGAILPAGVRFCTSCGTPIGNTFTQQNDDSEGTMILEESNPEQEDSFEGTMVLEETSMPFTVDQSDKTQMLNDSSMPFTVDQSDRTQMLNDSVGNEVNYAKYYENNTYNNSMNQGGNNTVQTNTIQSNSGNKMKLVIGLLCIMIVAAAVVLVLVWKGIVKLPFDLPFIPTMETETTTEVESSTVETINEKESGKGVSEEQLSNADRDLSEGKEKIENIEELIDGMENIESAMEQYKTLADEFGMSESVSEHMADAYDVYVSAIIKHKDMMAEQELSGGIHTQIMNEFGQAIAYAEEFIAAGFDVDTSLLISERDGFDTSYRNRVIKAFNEFASRDSWSRTEAWNLMDDTDNMFASDDLDDPIRLRYCYALAWWTQKQIESELGSGTITQKGAALKIAGILEATDYNLMLVDYYIQYMHAEGQDCSMVETAYLEILDKLADTQGLHIGEDVDMAHFWYFNDFGQYSVDDKNGVTTENRQWIRQRLGSVTF